MLVTHLNVSHTPQCKSHFSMLVTLLNVSQNLNVSHTPSLSVRGTRLREPEAPEVLVLYRVDIFVLYI